MTTSSTRGNGDGSKVLDELFHILADPNRRTALQYLRKQKSPVEIKKFLDEIAPTDSTSQSESIREQVYIRLLHVDLPKLADFGLVEYSTSAEIVEPTPVIDQFEPYLEWAESLDAQ